MGKIGLSLDLNTFSDTFSSFVKNDVTSDVGSLAIKIAGNLKNYTSNFQVNIPGEELYVAIPKQLAEKWFERFQQKWKKDSVFRANFI